MGHGPCTSPKWVILSSARALPAGSVVSVRSANVLTDEGDFSNRSLSGSFLARAAGTLRPEDDRMEGQSPPARIIEPFTRDGHRSPKTAYIKAGAVP